MASILSRPQYVTHRYRLLPPLSVLRHIQYFYACSIDTSLPFAYFLYYGVSFTVSSFMRIIIVVIISSSSIGSRSSIIIIIFTSSLLVTVTGPSVDFFNFWALDCLPPDSRAPRNWKILPTDQLLWLHHHPQPQYQCHTPLCLFSAFYLRPSSSKNTSVRRRSGRPSVRPSVCLSVTPFTMFLSSYHHWQKWCPCKRSRSEIKDQGNRVKTNFVPVWTFPDRNSRLDLQITDGYETMHKARSSTEEVPCCFSRSSVKFQSHRGQKNTDFVQNWAFPDCNSSFF